MRRTPEQTAILVALLLERSKHKRARISEKTIRRLARRKRLRISFLMMLREHLEDHALVMIELDDGSWGLMPSRGLQGAPTIISRDLLADDLHKLKRSKNPETVWNEFRKVLDGIEGVEAEED